MINSLDISKIVKRLELIKSLIVLEEEEDIQEQVNKLQKLQTNEEIKEIIYNLQQRYYGKAIKQIEEFLNSHQLTFYIDPEIEGLKLETKSLEAKLNKLSNEKADLEKLIHEFGVRHNSELGALILEILLFRKNKAKGTPKETEAEKDYNYYSNEYEVSKNDTIADLTEEERAEIKKKYRKASKLCHPDVVSEEQKELADKTFTELNKAYKKNDLEKVGAILENLENGNFFVNKSDAINEKKSLKAEIGKLRIRIEELKQQLQSIKKSEAYTTVNSIDDWDEYFTNAKQKLHLRLNELKHGE